MNLRLLVGIALFLIGIATAVVGITSVGTAPTAQVAVMAGEEADPALARLFRNIAVPAIAGLSLAIGGFLIGLSMGDWKHPRTHLEPGDEIVDPEGYHKMKHV